MTPEALNEKIRKFCNTYGERCKWDACQHDPNCKKTCDMCPIIQALAGAGSVPTTAPGGRPSRSSIRTTSDIERYEKKTDRFSAVGVCKKAKDKKGCDGLRGKAWPCSWKDNECQYEKPIKPLK